MINLCFQIILISILQTQFISADFFLSFVKLLTRYQSLAMKINTGYYGVPKQLYHTSYTPLESSRASSLQSNPTFTHSMHPPIRPEGTIPIVIMRDIPRSNLSGSQASQQELKSKLIPHEYYSKSSSVEDIVAQIQQKMQDLTKKVSKNTEDIKNLKNKEKTANSYADLQKKNCEELEKIQQKQAIINQECLLKIVKVKQELLEFSNKFTTHESQCMERLGLKTDEKMLIKVRNLIEERVKQETTKIRLIIENQTNKLLHDLRWEIKKEQATTPLKSKLKYPFKPVKLSYNEFMEVSLANNTKGRLSTRGSSESPRSGRYIISQQKTYFIDKDGYLLDQESYYLLDENDNMIRLDQTILGQLRREGILKQ